MEELDYEEEPEQQVDQEKKKKYANYNAKELEKNLEEMYEARKQIKEEK